jgi:predicted regulator of amino acid metabolism with ACT domain
MDMSDSSGGAASGTDKRTVKETIDAVEDQGFRDILRSLAKAIAKKDK